MKKIGKNTKLYLIGMIIGGITLGITTVIADTIINSTSVAYKTTTVKAALDELYDIADFKDEVKDMLYPVGSIYISVSSTNPSELFGGTWVSFGMGRTLIGMGTTSVNTETSHGVVEEGWYTFSNVEQMGGEFYHTLSVNEMPAHRHNAYYWPVVYTTRDQLNSQNASRPLCDLGTCNATMGGGYIASDRLINNQNMVLAGNSQSHNNIQPYITVYMWKRSA